MILPEIKIQPALREEEFQERIVDHLVELEAHVRREVRESVFDDNERMLVKKGAAVKIKGCVHLIHARPLLARYHLRGRFFYQIHKSVFLLFHHVEIVIVLGEAHGEEVTCGGISIEHPECLVDRKSTHLN